MSIAAYQTLYESSVAFGMRKALGGEQGKSDAEARIEHLEGRETDLERQVAELKARCDSIETREAERREEEEKRHAAPIIPHIIPQKIKDRMIVIGCNPKASPKILGSTTLPII